MEYINCKNCEEPIPTGASCTVCIGEDGLFRGMFCVECVDVILADAPCIAYECEICGASFDDEAEVKTVMEYDDGTFSFSCNDCSENKIV